MRLLICSTEYYPHGSGIANVAYNIVEELKNLGVDCTICSPSGPDIVLGSEKIISKFGRLGLIYYWFQVSNYFRNMDEHYDVVWLHQPFILFNNPFKVSVSTIHITTQGHFKASKRLNYTFLFRTYLFISSILEKHSLKKLKSTTFFVTDSPKVSQELVNIIGTNEKSIYIPNGVDTKRFKPLTDKKSIRNKCNLPNDSLVFIAIGRLAYQKNLFLMLDLFNYIQQKLKNCYLLIAGRGPLYQKLHDYIHEKNILNVKLLGFVSDNDLPSIYACGDFYVMTSEYEGLPLTLLEAMSSGLPCIVSNIPNLKLVEDANSGLFVDFSDKEKAFEGIFNYIQNKDLKHGDNARKYAVNNLDWEIIAKKYLVEFKLCNDLYENSSY